MPNIPSISRADGSNSLKATKTPRMDSSSMSSGSIASAKSRSMPSEPAVRVASLTP